MFPTDRYQFYFLIWLKTIDKSNRITAFIRFHYIVVCRTSMFEPVLFLEVCLLYAPQPSDLDYCSIVIKHSKIQFPLFDWQIQLTWGYHFCLANEWKNERDRDLRQILAPHNINFGTVILRVHLSSRQFVIKVAQFWYKIFYFRLKGAFNMLIR